MLDLIKLAIVRSIQTKQSLLEDGALLLSLERLVTDCVVCIENGGKILLCGNGGSAADAQHIAAELTGRFYYDRPPIDAEALHVNTSYITAVANDYDYDEIFARLIKAKGKAGDILIALSTSGNSPNVVKAAKVAREMGLRVAALTGEGGGELKTLSDTCLQIASKDTARIQECHILIGHILCEQIEAELYPR